MAVHDRSTDYLYLSARIRAMECGLFGGERLRALSELGTLPELLAALQAGGLSPVLREDGSTDTEAMLEVMLREGFDTVTAAAPAPERLVFLRYPYDCNNIKAILKCRVRGIPPEGLLSAVGSVSPDRLCEALAEERYGELPPHMGAAVPQALEAYAKTRDPQELDLTLDRACFADMAESTEGLSFARTAVSYRADLTNLMICLRLLRMGATYPLRDLLLRALVPGGALETAFFTEAFDKGESRFSDLVAMTRYAPILDLAGERTLAAVEKNADDLYMEHIRTARRVPFGAEVPIGYLVGLETSVKNLRILLAGRAAGLDAEAVRGRMRSSYV